MLKNDVSPEVADLLNEQAAIINSPSFIADDPVQFPRRFNRLQDIEIAALIAAIIAWGRRPMILRNVNRILNLMANDPYNFVMEGAYRSLDCDMNLHRTFFGRHLQYLLQGLHHVYSRYESLDTFAAAIGAGKAEAPSWHLAENLSALFCDANSGDTCSQCIPTNLQTTALKRINMALRWLVRDDGIVDLGVWKSIPKSKLYIPLDVHVGNVSRSLGLLDRKGNDRKAVEQLTATLRTLRPDDPAYYDFALFGIGVTQRLNQFNPLIP